MVSYRDVKSTLGRVQPVAWVALLSGLALIVSVNLWFTEFFRSLETHWQLIVIFGLMTIVSITGYKTASLEGILRPKKGRK